MSSFSFAHAQYTNIYTYDKPLIVLNTARITAFNKLLYENEESENNLFWIRLGGNNYRIL